MATVETNPLTLPVSPVGATTANHKPKESRQHAHTAFDDYDRSTSSGGERLLLRRQKNLLPTDRSDVDDALKFVAARERTDPSFSWNQVILTGEDFAASERFLTLVHELEQGGTCLPMIAAQCYLAGKLELASQIDQVKRSSSDRSAEVGSLGEERREDTTSPTASPAEEKPEQEDQPPQNEAEEDESFHAQFRLIPSLCYENATGSFVGLQVRCDGLGPSMLDLREGSEVSYAIVVHVNGKAEEGTLVLGQYDGTGKLALVRSLSSNHPYNDEFCELGGESAEPLIAIGPVVSLREMTKALGDSALADESIASDAQDAAAALGLALLTQEEEGGYADGTVVRGMSGLGNNPLFTKIRRDFEEGFAGATGSEARSYQLRLLCGQMFRAGQLSGVTGSWGLVSSFEGMDDTWPAGRVF